ncbi:hypothetical protein EDD16DRAFT_1208998 [Pisolithus croceorrhizus]|nr:hypothetical protein EDD16DRAFT_1208998 [Pisolithus croceorrhizus]KAI6119275.1 hypothetical protein EV401DRAFT_1502334 [Pisolithus croceorrhizus]KAI6165109.1 hypothetical protein EDD17DRAFT_1754304 [Pisolithus thermaeus]
MSFRWAVPERSVDHPSFPTLPVEIYLEILERLAPLGRKLSLEQTKTLTRFAGACKLFCHIALPRIYERVDLVGRVCYKPDDLSALREASWFSRISAREDLALWTVKCVKECNLRGVVLPSSNSSAVGVFAERYTSIFNHTVNLRRLTFTNCLIENEHWRAMMTLGALEELCIYHCVFAEAPQTIQPNHPVKISVPSVEFYRDDDDSTDDNAGVAAEKLDLSRLRSLKTDVGFAELLNWPQDCILEQLHVSRISYSNPEHQAILKPILRQTGQRVAELKLAFLDRIFLPDFGNQLRDIIPDNSQNLRSFTLVVDAMTREHVEAREMSSLVCRYIGFSPTMERLVVTSPKALTVPAWWRGTAPGRRFTPAQPLSSDHVQDITLRIILPVFPEINYVEIYRTALRLEGCSWVKVRAT